MRFVVDELYHVYNRGNNHEQVFYNPEHYHLFLRKLRAHVLPHCRVLAYCLMPNHFHLLLYTAPDKWQEAEPHGRQLQPLTRGVALTLSSYSQALNNQRGRSGALFQPKTKAKLLPRLHVNYPQACFHYIHQNPLRARLVLALRDWPYSSYQDFAGLRNGTFCCRDTAYALLDVPREPIGFERESLGVVPVEYAAMWR